MIVVGIWEKLVNTPSADHFHSFKLSQVPLSKVPHYERTLARAIIGSANELTLLTGCLSKVNLLAAVAAIFNEQRRNFISVAHQLFFWLLSDC